MFDQPGAKVMQRLEQPSGGHRPHVTARPPVRGGRANKERAHQKVFPGRRPNRAAWAASTSKLLPASSGLSSGCRSPPPNHGASRARCPGQEPAVRRACPAWLAGGRRARDTLPRTRQRCPFGRSADRRNPQSRATPFNLVSVSRASSRRPRHPPRRLC